MVIFAYPAAVEVRVQGARMQLGTAHIGNPTKAYDLRVTIRLQVHLAMTNRQAPIA